MDFGKQHFNGTVHLVDLEKHPDWHGIFGRNLETSWILSEQFVGQEFLVAGQTELYYWAREARSSTDEVDYILDIEGRTLPIEVKSGFVGRLRSLHLFLNQYQDSPVGYVFSCAHYDELPEQKLVFLPLYYG